MNWVYAIQMLTNVSKHVFIISLHDMLLENCMDNTIQILILAALIKCFFMHKSAFCSVDILHHN